MGDTLSLESGFAILCRSIVPTATAGVVSMTDDRQSSQRKWSLIEVDATGALRFEVTHPAPGRDCGPVGLGGHIVTAAWQDRSTNSPIQITRLDRRRPSEPPSVREVSPVNSTAVVKGLVPSGPHTLMISKADTRDGPELPTPIVITRELEGGGKEIVRFDDGPSFEPTMIASDDQSLRFYARRADAIDVYAVTCPDTQATP